MTTNPYEAPKSDVVDYQPPNDLGGFVDSPRACAAGRGAAWFGEGWELFARNPALWIGIVLVFAGVMFAAAMVPFLGMLAQNIVFPILSAGVVVGCDALRRGQPLEFSHLFAGFSHNSGPLVLLGVIYAVAVLAIALLSFVPTIGLIGGMAMMGSGDEEALLAAVGLPLLLGLLLMMALLTPMIMAIWFAPALVMLNDKQPIEAMRLSFFACLRNILPFLIFSLIGLLLAVVATIPLALGWLVLGPWFYTSNFCAYRDIFYAE